MQGNCRDCRGNYTLGHLVGSYKAVAVVEEGLEIHCHGVESLMAAAVVAYFVVVDFAEQPFYLDSSFHLPFPIFSHHWA